MEFTGGCLCGGTRYVLKSRPVALVDCHCIDCRRSAGAPYVQWGSVPRKDLVLTKGEPRKIAYANRLRSFAACCGTSSKINCPGLSSTSQSRHSRQCRKKSLTTDGRRYSKIIAIFIRVDSWAYSPPRICLILAGRTLFSSSRSLRACWRAAFVFLLDGEGLCDVNTALDLLARHIVDQRASNLLFGDRRRLQEDLLADAANAEVRKLLPKARGCPSGAHRRAR